MSERDVVFTGRAGDQELGKNGVPQASMGAVTGCPRCGGELPLAVAGPGMARVSLICARCWAEVQAEAQVYTG